MLMKIRSRYLRKPVESDLKEKMVFVGGPRQVGKTTFALGFLGRSAEAHPAYLNWDNPAQRSEIMKGKIPPGESFVIFDEIHKFTRWRNLVKGLYDTHKAKVSFLVTGSARLDYYRKGGDSLQGRYHLYRLHPFSLREMSPNPDPDDLSALLRFGGFPEPLFKGEETFRRRWQRERLQRVIYEDIRDLEHVKEISLIELLVEELPHRVGSPLSVKALSEDLQVAHETVERWLGILERMYVCFRISPYGHRRIRAVKKEQKLYFWDWSQCPEEGARFENLVACQLLKYCHLVEDTEGYKMELRFLRDTDKREVDFVVLKDTRPLFAVECKTGEKSVSPAARYFRARAPLENFFQAHLGKQDYGNEKTDVRVLPFIRFCEILKLP